MNASRTDLPLTQRLRALNLPLVAVLTAVALVRPLMSTAGLGDVLGGRPATPLILTAAISLIWILTVGLRRDRDPLLTLVVTGLAYALAVTVLSAVLSPILLGRLEGPLARPYAIVPLCLVNALWGAVCGALALALRRMRGTAV
ncbi:hypothetical protein ACIBCM_25710 [Streptomyces sp. NPDC051018]|uniref:hypothetical protein n=1 Tax=Streptomyces sp. NPDC051018 TaxID=3365639 RepID=UPI0037ADB409